MKRRADGRFQKRITLQNGKSKLLYSTAKTEREAIKDFNRQMLELEGKCRKSLEFNNVAENWSDEHFPAMQNNTLKQYKPCKREAVDYFGNTPINEITPIRIKKYLEMLSSKGFSKKTIKNRYAILKQIFNYAYELDLIEKNPCLTIKIKFVKDKDSVKRQSATAEEEAVIKNLSNDIPFAFLAKFLLLTGCRRGEAFALTTADIDFENGIVKINKTVEWLGNKPQVKMQPKTVAGNREIPLPKVLIEELQMRKNQKYIFQNQNSELFSNSQIATLWDNLKKETGINCTPHQLRHSYATMLFDADIDIKTAQNWLGHTDIKTTLDIYTHLSESRCKQSVEKWLNFVAKTAK